MNEVEYVLRIVLQARDQIATVLRSARQELQRWRSEVKASNQDMNAMNTRISSMNQRVGALAKSFDRAGAAIHNFASRKRDADDLIGKNIQLFDKFEKVLAASAIASRAHAEEAREVGRAHSAMSRTTDANTRSISRNRQEIDRSSKSMGGFGDNIATLDNKLRGIGLLVAFTFAQQLLSVLIGLGGQFVAVGSSAAMAGAGIGGSFVAGISQALPAIGLLAAALQRAGHVMDAVNQAQTAQQQQFVQQATAGRRTADATDSVANAQQSLADAQDRVAEASENLRRVREEGVRELQDLIDREHEAELAARGAALGQREARDALRGSVRRGDLGGVDRAELSLAESRLRAEQSITDVRRSRVDVSRAGGDVENLDSVRQARKQLEDAERAAHRADRSMQSAKRNAVEAAAGTETAAATLQFFLSQLSPAERRLYQALRRIQDTYKASFRPITDIIIDSFTRTVDAAEKTLRRRDVIDAATDLADEIATQLNRVTDELFSDKTIGQVIHIVRQAKNNLEPFVDIVLDLAHAWLNIAENANPALKLMLTFIGDLANRFEKLTENDSKVEDFFTTGERHFEAWVNLGLAVIKLFAAIAGEGGGAESGLDTVRDATKGIDDLTRGVKENADDVQQFFKDSRFVLDQVVRVVVALAQEIFRTFDPEKVRAFADFIIEVIIPALGTVIRTVSSVTAFLAQIFSTDVGGFIARIVLVALAFGQVASSAHGAYTYIKQMMSAVLGPIDRVLTKLGAKQKAIDAIGTSASKARDAFKSMLGFVGRLVEKVPGLRGVGGALQRAGRTTTPAGEIGPGAGTSFTVDSQGNVVDTRTRPAPPRTSRRGRIARGVGAAGLAAGAVALSASDTDFQSLRDIYDDDVLGRLQSGLLNVKSAFGALMSLDIGGVFKSITRNNEALSDFASDADVNIKKMVDERNVRGLRDMAKQARDQAKDFPEAADALEQFASSAEAQADKFEETEKKIDGLSRAARRFVDRNKINADDMIDPNAVSQFQSNLHRMSTAGVTSIEDLRKNIRFNLDKINQGFTEGSQGWLQAISENMEGSVEAITEGMKNGSISQRDGMREIRKITREQMRLVRDNIDDMSSQAKDSIAGNFRDARLAVERQTHGWEKATGDALRRIRRLMRDELEIYGLSPAQARNIARGGGHGRQFGDPDANRGREGGAFLPASGGIAGGEGAIGQRGGDEVNARIGLGEMVLGHAHQRYIAPAVEAFYGHPLGKVFNRIRGIHAGIGRWAGDKLGFATGGIVGIPGFPGEEAASSIIGKILSLVRRFPSLRVTDAYDRDHSGGHKSPGHNITGTAVDFAGPDRVMDAAVRALTRAGYLVGYDGRFGSQAWPGHGPTSVAGSNAHLHVEFGGAGGRIVGKIADLGRAIRRIGRVSVDGPESPFGDIANASVNNVAGAAVHTLRRAVRSIAQTVTGPDNPRAQPADANVIGGFRRALRSTGAHGRAALALWEAGIVESGLRNLTYGDRDSQGALQIRTQLHGLGLARNPFAAAMAFLLKGFFGKGGAISLAGQFPRATAGWIAQQVQGSAFPGRYDQVASRARQYMGFRFGGDVPGYGGGDVYPRLLEGGEHVWTKEEVARAGGHGVMRMLRAMLGGGGQGGPDGYQEGGGVSARQRSINQLTRFTLSDNNFRSAQEVLFDISRLFTQVGQLRAITKGVRPFIALVNKLAGEGGLLDELRTSVERKIENASRRLLTSRFTVGRGGVVTERLDDVQAAQADLRNQRGVRGLLTDERGDIAAGLRRVRQRQGRDGLSPGQRRRLQAAENNLQQRLRDADQRIAENTETIFNAQETLTQAQEAASEARKQAQQDVVDDINTRFGRESGRNEIFRRIASALGNQDWLQQINGAQRDILTRQANELEGRIKAARDAGNEELAQQLEDQVQDLRTQVFESVQQDMRDAMDAVNNAATRRLGRLDLFNRMLDAVGAVGQGAAVALGGESFSRAGIFAQRGAALEAQRSGLQGVLGQAQAAGNVGLIQDLTDQLAELEVAIKENTKAAFQAQVDAVNSTAGFGLNVNDLNAQIIRLTGEISGNTDQAGLLRLQQERQTILLTQRTSLEKLLAQAQDAGDQQAVQDLTVAILENQVATLENTKAINELNGSVTDPQSFTTTMWQQFREAFFNGMGQVLPQYVLPAAGSVASAVIAEATRGGATGTPHHGESRRDWHDIPPTINQDIDINYNEVNEAPSPLETASRVAWYGKTANTET